MSRPGRRTARTPKAARRPEPGFPIGLVALDIDGTIVGPDLVLGERIREVVGEAVRRGVHVSLVTGRMASSALGFARALGLSGPIVAYQGALIRSIPDPPLPGERARVGRLLRHTPLAPDAARDAVRWCLERGLRPHLNHLERLVVPADDPDAADYSAFLGARAIVVDDLAGWIRHPVTKVIAVGDEERVAAALAEARSAFAGRAAATVSHPRFLEFVAPGVSKGRAVRWLARRLGVPLERTLAIGDQWNDLEMLVGVGHGAAMPTAPREVRAAARYVAPSLEDDGAAATIEALVLAPPETAARNAVELARRAGSAALAGPAGDLASEAGPSPGPDGSAEGSVAALIAGRP